MEAMNVEQRFTAVEAPWQNGICERANGSWKLAARSIIREMSLSGISDMRVLSVMMNWAKNARVTATGYSASQWVLGRGIRMPWGLLDEGASGRLSAEQ